MIIYNCLITKNVIPAETHSKFRDAVSFHLEVHGSINLFFYVFVFPILTSRLDGECYLGGKSGLIIYFYRDSRCFSPFNK